MTLLLGNKFLLHKDYYLLYIDMDCIEFLAQKWYYLILAKWLSGSASYLQKKYHIPNDLKYIWLPFLVPYHKSTEDIFFSDKFSSNVAIKEASNIKFDVKQSS